MARRIGRLSKREVLIIKARKRRLRFKASISDNELENLINRSPITEDERKYVKYMLERLPGKPKCPDGMTYGQYRKVRTIATENDNEYAIRELKPKLEEGGVFEYEGEYYYIKNILGDLDLYKMWVQKVTLHRGKEDKVTITPIGDRLKKFDPFDLLFFGGSVIDLATWQPEVDIWASFEEEPDSSEDDPFWSSPEDGRFPSSPEDEPIRYSSDEDPPF